MSFVPCFCWWLLALSLNFNSPVWALIQPTSAASAVQNSSDETALRALAEAFFKTWAAKDPDGFLRLWSQQSPELEARKKSWLELFASSEKIEVNHLLLRQVKIEGEKASVRVALEATVIEAKTGQPRSGYGKMLRALHYVKEESHWKVWREVSAFDELAATLAVAKSDQERAAYLAEEKELVTAELVSALDSQGDRFSDQGNYPQALTIYRLAQSMAEQIGDQPGIARTLYHIGNVHLSQGNYAQALEYLQKSRALNEALGDQVGIARTLNSIGNIHFSQGNYAQALELFQQSLAMLEAVGNKAGIANALNNIGNIYQQQGNYAQALECFQKSRALSEELGNKEGIARTLNNIGNIYQQQGNYAQALECLQKSLAISEALGNKARIANTLNNIGNAYYEQSNNAQALEYFQKSLALREALGDKEGLSYALGSIGNVYLVQGNYAQALEYFQKSLAISETLGDKATMTITLDNIGFTHDSQGNYARALEYLQKSLALRETLGNKDGIARTLNNIGNIHYHQGSYVSALEYFQKSLAIREAIGDKDGMATTLGNLGKAHEKQGHHAPALDFAERAAALARQIGDTEAVWRSRLTAGTAYRALNQPAQARLALEEAITTIEAMRHQVAGGEEEQQRFFESKVSPYHAMVDLLIAQSKPTEALTFAERAKARVLLDVLHTGRVNVTKAMTGEEREQEHKLNRQLVSLNTQIDQAPASSQPDQAHLTELKAQLQKARLDFEAFQTNLYAAHPELRVQRGQAQPLRLEETTALLPDAKSALLEFVVAEDKTYLFVMTKSGGGDRGLADLKAYPLEIKRDELSKQIEVFRQQLAGRDLGFRASAAKLYELLLKPAQAQIKGKTNLVIVPDDKLWDLPFQALLASAHRFLIEDAAIAYAPSLTVLREMTKRQKNQNADAASSTLLALGNPLLGKETKERAQLALRDEKLSPLPEAEQEVNALGQLYGTARSKVYVGSEAREDRVKAEAGQMRVLHFATHGILNNASPMYSHLVLAQGDTKEDGLLEAWEIMQLDLHADLAILSACETARGRFGAGEGMIGLTWALFVAGVPSTVVSQWQVESASTRDLMLSFHRQLRTPSPAARVTKAEALRQAALSLMKHPETSHPFYWAGFVLVGDGR